MDRIHPIILAAGKGTRMGGDLPKALIPFKGKPLLMHVLITLQETLPRNIPTIVVGHKADDVRNTAGPTYRYALQTEQRGTGHAVAAALPIIPDSASHIIVLYADQPLLSSETIKRLIETHQNSGSTVTMGTVTVPDFGDWRRCFERFGRVIRGKEGSVVGIKEWKDATKDEQSITEVNPSYFCFKRDWLYNALRSLTDYNAAREYYLTDVVAYAVKTGESIATVPVEPHEALGVNTPEELALAEAFG